MSTPESRVVEASTIESPNSVKNDKNEDPNPSIGGGNAAADTAEEEGECGFCLFMKGGGCKDSFEEWEKCLKEADEKEEDVVSKCAEVTLMMHKCMQANAKYYAPLLKAEETALKQLEKEAGEAAMADREKSELVESGNGSGAASSTVDERKD